VSLLVSQSNEASLAVAIEKGSHGTAASTNQRYLVIGEAIVSHAFDQRGKLRRPVLIPVLIPDLIAVAIFKGEFESCQSDKLSGFDEVKVKPGKKVELLGAPELGSYDLRYSGPQTERRYKI